MLWLLVVLVSIAAVVLVGVSVGEAGFVAVVPTIGCFGSDSGSEV